jgi:hypothetical protein
MNATDLDPNFLLPFWQALVRYFRAYPPLVQGSQQLELPLPRERRKTRLARGWASSEGCERPSRTARAAGLPAAQGRDAGKLTQSSSYLPEDIERRLPQQPSP